MAEESSTERSVNSVVICGAVTRRIRKAKNPIERDGDRAHRHDPRRAQGFEERSKGLHGTPLESARRAPHPARIAQFMVTARLIGWSRLALSGDEADRNGLRMATPVGAKSEAFRVTTVRRCSSAVAAMARSSDRLPSLSPRHPTGERLKRPTAKCDRGRHCSSVSSQRVQLVGEAGVSARWRSDAALDLGASNHAQVKLGIRGTESIHDKTLRIGVPLAQFRKDDRIEQIRHRSMSRRFPSRRSKLPSSFGHRQEDAL